MSNVTSFSSFAPTANELVIEHLEDALERARSGELQEVAIVGTLIGSRTYTAYSTDDVVYLVGLLAQSQHSILARQREGLEEDLT